MIAEFSKRLESDIRDRIDIHKDSVEVGEPVMTRADAIRELAEDSDHPTHYSHEHRNELNDYLISIGVYKEVTVQQLENVQVTSGHKYDLKRKGKLYMFESWKPLEENQNKTKL